MYFFTLLYKKTSLLLLMITISMLLTSHTVVASNMIKRVSVDSEGNEANDHSYADSQRPVISEDGRYVTFNSQADNLVEQDTNEEMDVFVHDMGTSITTRVSVDSEGNQANGHNTLPTISANGRYVIFTAWSDNLVEQDSNETGDAFVHDRETEITSRVSVANNDNNQGGNEDSYAYSISANGQFIAFTSEATNLIEEDILGYVNVFVHDSVNKTTTLVSVNNEGEQGLGYNSGVSMSTDGRYISFSSGAPNLVENDVNNAQDIFIHDKETSTTQCVSINTNDIPANDHSELHAISANGSYITFSSRATDLVDNIDINGDYNRVYVRDLVTNETTLVSINSDGKPGNDDSYSASISANGRFVTFASRASNLAETEDTNNALDIFVHDRMIKKTIRISVDKDGNEADGHTGAGGEPYLSADGRFVVFKSNATNLVPNDTNNAEDVFVAFNSLSNVLFVDGFESND